MLTITLLILCAVLSVLTFSAGIMMATGQQIGTASFYKLNPQDKHMNRKRSMENSFTVRVLYPFAQKIFYKLEMLVPVGGKSWVQQNLIQAGLRKPNYPAIFIGGQILLAILAPLYGGFMAFVLFRATYTVTVIVCLCFSLIGFFLPVLWLGQAVKRRKAKIWKSLPDFLDLLVISVEAGLGLDAAIQKITENDIGKRAKELRSELLLYLQDVSLGKPRHIALKDFSNRIGLDDLNIMTHALVQAFEMGNSVAHTLRVQSDIMRTRRIQTAEEEAAKIPVKMVPPIYLFLFPAIFISILGPLVMLGLKSLSTIMQGAAIK